MAKRRRRSKKWISWLFLLMLLIAAIAVCSMVFKSYFGNEKEEPESELEVKKETKEDEDEEPEEQEVVEKEEVVQYDGEDPNNSEEITGVITYAGVSGDSLMIRVNIDQYLSNGQCSLKINEYGTEIYNDSALLVNSASTMTCEGFDVPIPAIGGGDFEIIINVDADGKSGTITGEVSV
ncbi:hypothetical protein IJH24_02550 [Candidatus Saccharibacteria bacterium]|nr:hypothetical protein [Candidatus Saccharibacteria bacterium]